MNGVPLDRPKLVRVLGLLGSERDGEIAAAGRAANAMLQKAGISWADVITPDGPGPAPTNVDGLIAFCLGWGSALSLWEHEFLRALERQRRSLSTNQTAVLVKIYDGVRAYAEARVR